MVRRAFVRTIGVACAAVWLVHCSGKTPMQPTPQLTIACPANVTTRAAIGAPTAVVTFSDPTTSGGKAPVTTACTAKSGEAFTPGSYAINCSAVDAEVHSAACTFTITVDPAPIPRLGATRFAAFGDSLTEGKVSIAPLLVLPSAYTLKLTAMLQARYSSPAITVTGEGVGGSKAVDDVGRFDTMLASDKPEVVLLMEGANDLDAKGDDGVDPAIGALGTMAAHATARGIPVFIATIPPEKPFRFGAGVVTSLNAKIVSLAASRQLTLVDVYTAFNGDLSLIGADGLHPTDAGHQVIAQAFYDRIVAKLELPLSAQ